MSIFATYVAAAIGSVSVGTYIGHYVLKPLTAPPPLNPALLGTGVTHKLTHPEFIKLEKEALQLESADKIAQYQTAILDKYFPEFSYNGAPRYIVQVREKLDDGTRVKEAIERSLTDPKTMTDIFALQGRNRAHTNQYDNYNLNKYLKNQASGVESLLPISAGNASPYFLSVYSSEKAYFVATNFSKKYCTSCQDSRKELDCDRVISPKDHRKSQLFRFDASEHETAHAISFLFGAYSSHKYASTDARWLSHVEENTADAYAALRTISKFGAEGLGYLKEYRWGIIEGTNTSTNEAEYQSSLAHWSLLTLNNIIDLYDDHPELLKDKTPPELFALAQNLIRTISPEALAELYAIDFRNEKGKNDPASLKFNALVGQTKHTDTALFLDYQVDPEIFFSGDKKILDQLKLMPHMPPSFGKKLKDFSDKELLDMAKFDAAHREGSPCSAAGYPERFRKYYKADDALVARVKKMLPPHLK